MLRAFAIKQLRQDSYQMRQMETPIQEGDKSEGLID